MSNFFGQTSENKTKETYETNEVIIERMNSVQLQLGRFTSAGLLNDPRQVGFRIARQKFAAKMLADFDSVLEIGCQEGFTSLFLAPYVKKLVAIDFYKPHLDEARKFVEPHVNNVFFLGHDILDSAVYNNGSKFDGAFSLDVLEHIEKDLEDVYMKNISDSLKEDGVFIVGMPSLESQSYASEASKMGHINCKTAVDLNVLCRKYYKNVFMFGMNDEVLHTGFFHMCHYIIAMCVGKRCAN